MNEFTEMKFPSSDAGLEEERVGFDVFHVVAVLGGEVELGDRFLEVAGVEVVENWMGLMGFEFDGGL